jgi:hypothetical protein
MGTGDDLGLGFHLIGHPHPARASTFFGLPKCSRDKPDLGLYLLPHQSNMPPMRPPVSNAFFCFASRLS